MISGNPSQVLKSMPANSVKDIEVITDPGAKYDAEGVGGIINIVTDKRADDGYTGSVGANGDTFGGYGANAYLATKYGKFGFTGNAGYYRYLRPTSNSTFHREEFDTQGEGFIQESLFENPMRHLRLSVTYRFGELKTSMRRVQRGISNEDVLQGGSSGQEGGAATGGGNP